ncbi:Aldose reductase, partial [Trichoplax sp. H2]
TIFQGHDNILPLDDDGVPITGNEDYKTTWKAMERLVDDGLVKAISLSNFNTKQVDNIMENCSIKPAVNQFETHPYMTCNRWIQQCQRSDIAVTAYCPLGSRNRPDATVSDNPILLNDPVVQSIGKKYNKPPAQVCLRFNIQRSIVVIPKSTTPLRITENSQISSYLRPVKVENMQIFLDG